MSSEYGDRALGHGDADTRVNSTGSTIEAGMWVVPTGNETVGKSDVSGAGGTLVGVTADPLTDGEKGNVHYRGVVYARVDSAVLAGDQLGAPDSGATTPGTPGVAEAGGTSGIFAIEDAQDDGSGKYFAKCLVR